MATSTEYPTPTRISCLPSVHPTDVPNLDFVPSDVSRDTLRAFDESVKRKTKIAVRARRALVAKRPAPVPAAFMVLRCLEAPPPVKIPLNRKLRTVIKLNLFQECLSRLHLARHDGIDDVQMAGWCQIANASVRCTIDWYCADQQLGIVCLTEDNPVDRTKRLEDIAAYYRYTHWLMKGESLNLIFIDLNAKLTPIIRQFPSTRFGDADRRFARQFLGMADSVRETRAFPKPTLRLTGEGWVAER